MSHNRYYIINSDDPHINDINAIIVGSPETQRYSLDRSKIVVKLHENDHSSYIFLEQYEEMSHVEILEIMNSPEWTREPNENE